MIAIDHAAKLDTDYLHKINSKTSASKDLAVPCRDMASVLILVSSVNGTCSKAS